MEDEDPVAIVPEKNGGEKYAIKPSAPSESPELVVLKQRLRQGDLAIIRFIGDVVECETVGGGVGIKESFWLPPADELGILSSQLRRRGFRAQEGVTPAGSVWVNNIHVPF